MVPKRSQTAGRDPLHYAAVEGRLADVRDLIDGGADVDAADASGMTPLHFACQMGHVDVAKQLLTAGAPVDAVDSYGNTALWKAAFGFTGGEPILIRLLLAAGADPDLKNHTDRSPREMALLMDRPGVRSVFP